MRKFFLTCLVLVLGFSSLVSCSKDEYMNTDGLSPEQIQELDREVREQGDALVSQLGPFEDEYDLIHSLVFKFMNGVIKTFPGRTIDKTNVKIDSTSGDYIRGKISSAAGSKAYQLDEGIYVIDFKDINNLTSIKRISEIAANIFQPAGFKGEVSLPTRKMKDGLYNFNWNFVKPSGISDSKVKWHNYSIIKISGYGNLAVDFSTDTRMRRKDLTEYKQTHPTASVEAH